MRTRWNVSVRSRLNWNLEGWFLRREENRRTRRKTSYIKGENQQQTQLTFGVNARIWARPHWWEASALTTAPLLLVFDFLKCSSPAPWKFCDCSIRWNTKAVKNTSCFESNSRIFIIILFSLFLLRGEGVRGGVFRRGTCLTNARDFVDSCRSSSPAQRT